MKRFVQIETPLAPDVLLFNSMRGREELSRLSEYELDLLSSDRAIKLDDVLGKTVDVTIELENDEPRHFTGYVTRISLDGMHGRFYRYRATVRPWLWLLTRTTNCRIYQEKSVPDILKEVFATHAGVADVKFELTETYTPWEYCVQYRETDFNFVSRLMEHEGMYYFFKHTKGRHTLVIADSYSAHTVVDGGADLPFIEAEKQVRAERAHVSQWSITHELQPGKYALTDYDFEKPSVDLQVKSKIKREHAMAEYEVYDYPGDYIQRGDGELYVRTRMEEVQAKFERVRGETNARAMATGHLFTLTSHPRADQNTEYLVVSAVYEVTAPDYESSDATGAEYHCTFTALNSHQPFRAERTTRKPIVEGPQTAITVGPPGETIHTDKFGRVKVQFHWDRYGKKDDKSSCWIRVSQNWGGKGWGGMFIPHVKQEVIVQFLEGDPDMPLITGRVYNAENMPPVSLPAGKTKSIIRDHGANEIVMEGEGGKQRITMYSPHSDTKFSMGAPNSPAAGFFFKTDQEWNEYVNANSREVDAGGNVTVKINGDSHSHTKGNVDVSIVGDSKTYMKGHYVCQVDGYQEYSTVGHYVTKVLGYNWVVIVGADTDVYLSSQQALNVGLHLNIYGNVRYQLEKAADICKSPSKKYMEGEEKKQIGSVMKKIGKETKDVAGQLSIKAAMMKHNAGSIVGVAKNSMEWQANMLQARANTLNLRGDKMIAEGEKIFKKGDMKINNVMKITE